MQTFLKFRVRKTMLDFETKISGIDYKIRQLIESKKELEKKLSESEQRNRELETQIYNNNLIIKQLGEKNKILNLGNTISDKGDTTEIKIKINRLIREIDKSIELLTKVEKKHEGDLPDNGSCA